MTDEEDLVELGPVKCLGLSQENAQSRNKYQVRLEK